MLDAGAQYEKRSSRVTILVVEDEFLIRTHVADYLGDLGFKVILAANAAEALDALKYGDFQIDIVFSDIDMPGPINGLGLSAWIFENMPGLPVILGSGSPHRHKLTKKQSEELLRKPYELSALLSKIRSLVKADD